MKHIIATLAVLATIGVGPALAQSPEPKRTLDWVGGPGPLTVIEVNGEKQLVRRWMANMLLAREVERLRALEDGRRPVYERRSDPARNFSGSR